MSVELVIANVDRAGDHAAVFGVLLLAAAVAGLVYGLVRIAARSRTRSKTDRRPDA
jgi:hypothetical protein